MLRLRLIGVLLGGSLSTVGAVLSHWIGAPWWEPAAQLLATVGIPAGIVVGFIAAPGAMASRRPVLYALAVGFQAVMVGLALYIGWGSVASIAEGRWPIYLDALVWIPFFVLNSLVVALPITIPVAVIAVGILRLRRRRRALAGALIVGSLVLAVGLSALHLADPRRSIDVGGLLPADPPGEVLLEWTVANHSTEPLQLSVWTPHEDGASGWSMGLMPCFIETGTTLEGDGWYITLEPYDDYEWAEPAEPVVSAADAPGERVRVWLDVDPAGRPTVHVGRGAPPAVDLTVDLCLAGQPEGQP